MSALSFTSDAHPAPDSFPKPLRQAMDEIARLLDSGPPAAAFFDGFLKAVRAALASEAVAVWAYEQDAFRLEHQLNLAAVQLDQTPNGARCHDAILRRVARRDRPVWAPPRSGPDTRDGEIAPANLTAYGLLLAPILVDGETAGVLEAWQGMDRGAEQREEAARFLTAAAGFAAAYLHKTQWRQLRDQHLRQAQVESLTRQLHGTLDPRELAFLVANQGRLLTGCDQCSVGLRERRRVRVEAISGATTVEARSPLVQAMRALFDSVLTWGEKVIYRGTRDETLPPAVLKALDAYLARSNSRSVLVLPLRDPRESEASAALLLEGFDPAVDPAQLETRAQEFAPHATAALHNALAYRRATAGPLTKGYAALCDWTSGKRGRTLGLVVALLTVVAAALTFIPASLRIEARGQLLPRDRQVVYATRPGKIVELKTHHGDQVQKGQELLYLEDLDAQLKVEQLGIKVAYAEQRLAALTEQLGKAGSPDERNALLKERINQEYELRKATAERDVLLHESRSPRKSPLTAPLSGKLVTFDAREQLVGKTVKPGDPLVRIARVQGPWEIELNLPESTLAPIREGLRSNPDGALDVHLLLASQPLRAYRGRLRWDGLGGETTVKDGAVVLPVRVEVTDEDLAGQLSTLPVGLEVRARVDCGPRPIGTVWFGDLLEFVYARLLF